MTLSSVNDIFEPNTNLGVMNKDVSIFIIDDDLDDAEIFIEAMNVIDASIKCDLAKNGEDALRKLKNPEIKTPEIIFLDLNMPLMDGRQLLKELKKSPELSKIPVAIYTTSSSKSDMEETKKLGASHFITKPSEFNQLCSAISVVLFSEI